MAGLATDSEPQVAGDGQEALPGPAVEFGGVLSDVRGDAAEPVGLVAGVEQVPQLRSHGLEVVKEPMQVLGSFGAALAIRAGTQQPCGRAAGRLRAAADPAADLECVARQDTQPPGDRFCGARRAPEQPERCRSLHARQRP